MIASLSGTVEHVALDRAVIAVGGLGVQFSATPQTLATLHEGRPGAVQTHLVVKEDALTLYGFADRDEREVFEVLITANGVGPRLALAILSVHHPETLRRAVTEEDEKTLTRVPGIGPKMARKIIVELSGRLAPTGEPVPEAEAEGVLPAASPDQGGSMTEYTLPELDYDYAALEPHISARIMELHHSKHHATYVKGANTALEKLAAAREAGDFGSVNQLSKDLAFNLGGHTNHSIFWKNLSPEGGDKPTGELAAAIDEYFGSFDQFQAHFTAAALGIQGSGWAVLGYDHIAGRLIIQQLTDQQGNVSVDFTPVLMLDMWEHAYYLQYKNVKADYAKAFWNVVNWDDVAERYAKASA